MQKENVGGIFFTEKENDFGKLFNEFNVYIRGLDGDMSAKEALVFSGEAPSSSEDVIQALNSYSSKDLSELKGHFRALNDAFDSIESRIQNALDAIII